MNEVEKIEIDEAFNPTIVLIRMFNNNNETIGELKVTKDGAITFEGNFDESAERFADHVCQLYKERIDKNN